MKLSKYLLLLLTCISLSSIAQNQYNDLPLAERIKIKEGHSPFYTSAKLGQGVNPVIQTTGPEQDCNSAIPVCQNVYTTSVSYSGVGANDEIPSNSCLGSNEKNSVWYTFNTSSAGNLAFNINPNSSSDDYDFALYDITGSNCSGIASGAITPIRCNFSATSGLTGLSASGSNPSEPASGPNQSTVLATTAGKTYVLIISNYSSSQSGYTLDFSPGTASIFDVTPPTIIGVTAPCGSNSVVFNASEQIKCSTIAANGSDFTITGTGGPYVVTAAAGQNCGVNTAQINLTISPALSGAGPWTVGVTTGSDGNTLIDPCGNAMLANTHTFSTSPPAVTISGPTSVCKGVVFALTASSASSYTWTGGSVPGGQQNQQTISVTPATAGTLNFTVTVTNGTCGNASATQAVTIKEGPTAHFLASTHTVCAGTPVSFTTTSTIPCTLGGSGISLCNCGSFGCGTTSQTNFNVLHTWSFSDPLSGTSNFGTGTPISHTFNTPGTYFVNLNTNFLIGGGCNTSETQTITVLPATPNLTVSATTTICPGQSSTLTATGGTTYTWTPAATLNTPNGGTVVATPTITTTYTVSTPGCAGNQTATVQVVIGGTPPAIGAITGSTTICPNSTGITYSVTNVASTNYTWSVPAGATITSAPTNSNAITVNFGATAGTVSVTAVGTCGTSTAAITVSLSPALSLTVTPNASAICPGSTVALTASGATNYTWSPAATLSSSNGTSVTASPSTAITYTILGSTGTCTGSTTASISMSAGLTLTLTSNTPTVCSTNPSALLDVNGATTYTWFPSATLSSANGSNVTASPLVNTTYTVLGSTGTCTGVATINIGIGVCVSSACNLALIRSTLTAAGNVELLGMNNTCSLYFINPQFMTGPQAQTYAQGFGANLISVQSASENTDLVQALSNQGYAGQVIWIGYSDAITEGSFVWYDGSPLSYSNWAPGEPNNSGGNENCTQIYPDGSWNDLNCAGYNSLSVIEVNICPQVSVVNVPPTHCPLTNVTMNASTLLGSPNYTYTWVQSGAETFTTASTGSSLNDQISITSMGPNTFTVFTEDRYSCPQSTTVNLTVFPTPTITANSATICAGQQTATLTANGATTYSWIPGTGLSATTGAVVTGTPASTQNYTVIGMDGNGCLNGTVTAITVNSVPSISVSPNVTICPLTSTTLTASGAPSYTWSPSSSLSSANGSPVVSTPSISTTYTVQGAAANGCIGSGTVNVNVSGGGFPPDVYIVQKNSLCDTSLLNWLNVTSVTPGLAQGNLPNGVTFTATHSGGGLSTTPSMFSGATFPATYSVPIAATTIRNDLAGTFNFCFSQPVINPQIAFASIGQAVLPITITTGVPYQVLWTGINMTYVNPTTLIGAEGFTIIRFPGVHTCISFDYSNNETYINLAFGVMDTQCQDQPICPGDPIELIANGAASYTWSTGASTSTISPTPSVTTTYSVLGVTVDGCPNTATTSVIVNPTPTVTVNSVSICVGQQTATLTANGAASYTWSPSATLSSNTGTVVTGTPPSTQNYTVVGTDANGCIANATTTITVNPLPTVAVNSASICIGQQTATLTATGASTYSWSPSTDLSSNAGAVVTGTPIITQSYSVIGTDANGCFSGNTSTITVNSLPIITVNSATICVGQQTATLTAAGATTYSWIPGTGLSATTGAVVTGTPSATQNYTVGGMDANGCINGTITAITVNPLPTVTVNSSTICVGQQTATLTANGASTYTWIPGTGLSATTGAVVTGTPSATQNYTVGGIDVNGCINGAVTAIIVNPLPTVTVNSSSICIGQQTATLIANGASTYSWNPAVNLSSSSGTTVTGTPAATENYSIVGTDINGCFSNATSTITVNSLPTVTVTSATICVGQQTATLTAGGATTYSWTPGTGLNTTTGAIVTGTPITTQSYSVTGTDGNGCFSGNTSTITVNSLPIITANSATICVGQQTATLTANGASTYSWIPGTGLSATNVAVVTGTPGATQSYTVAGMDANGCINGTVTAITVNPLPVVSVSPDMTVCPLSANTLTASGASTYTWSPNIFLNTNTAASVISTPSTTTTYTIDVTSALSCTNTAVMTIVVNNSVVVNASASTATICPAASTSLTATGATSYTWSPSLTLSAPNGSVVTASPPTSTTYTVIGSTSTCTNSAQVVITLTVNPTLTIVPTPSVICSGNSSTLTASGASTYTWSPATALSATNTAAVHANPAITTVYNISGTSPLGCIGTTSTTLTVVPTPTVSTTSAPGVICAGANSTLSAFGATDYTWSPSASVTSPNNSSTNSTPAFTTTYTVIGSNGVSPFLCFDTKTVQVTVIPNPTLTPSPSVPICEGQSTLLYAIGAQTYTWSPTTGVSHIHDSTTHVKPPLPGIYVYTVTGTTNNCSSTATVEITVNALPIIDAGLDSTINIDQTIALIATGNTQVGFINASSGVPFDCNYCPTVTVNPQESTCYTLEGISSFGCRNTDEVCITVTKDWDVFIPNAFTPNGDLNNEVFAPVGYGIEKIQMLIFDRWGIQIFKGEGQTVGWDGTNKGKTCEQDVYIYKVEVKAMSGEKYYRTGHVTLIGKVK